MTLKDVVKSSVLDKITSGTGFNIREVIAILLVSLFMGIYIFIVYKNFSKSAYYSKDLNVTIAGMCIVVAAIMIAMESNLLVSLGMVGALSIVRFRTAVKNPLDLLYLFWAISVGIIDGVGLYLLGVILCVMMTFLIWGLSLVPNAKAPVVLMVKMSAGIQYDNICKVIKHHCSFSRQMSIITRNDESELIYEIKTKDRMRLVEELNTENGVISVSCLEHDGEVRI